MIDWNALAEKHKLGTTEVERTLTLVCREMANLVPQEKQWDNFPQEDARPPAGPAPGDD